MTKKYTHSILSKYVLRTSLLPVSTFYRFISKKKILDKDYKDLCKNSVFMEAIFLASPSFYYEVVKWLNGDIKDVKASVKIKHSILKYYSRMSSRCTPFGLFAGFSVGEFSEKTNIMLDDISLYKRTTKLDMNFLVALSQNIVKKKEIRKQLTFYPNSSIYSVGSKIRYIEYYYVKNNRKHEVIEVENTDYLNLVLDEAKSGKSVDNLASILVIDNISYEEAYDFIEELIQSQLLVSELEPAVTGIEFLDQLCVVLKNLNNDFGIREVLMKVDKELKKLDENIGNDPEKYIAISEILKPLGTKFEMKYLFQTDLVIATKENTIDTKFTHEILEAFALLNKITIPPPETELSKFKKAFIERYSSREVSLSKVLDVEFGIGYKQNQDLKDINPLIDDIIFPLRTNVSKYVDIRWNPVLSILQKKKEENTYTIKITEQDFVNIDIGIDSLPDTISSMIQFVKVNGQTKIKFKGAGGSSATIYFGRFCFIDEKIRNLTNEIIESENKLKSNSEIFAEIVHLPQARVGNVLMRPEFRDYEIPYLAKSSKPKNHQIFIEDLTISINQKGRLILKSKKLKKEVIPRMANAHNYNNANSLPIYHFLCDMQSQGIRNGIGIGFGTLTDDDEFLPRIEYKNVIIKEATWNLNKKHIKVMLENSHDDFLLEKEVKIFRSLLKLPQWVYFVEGDNQLLINLNNLSSLRMLLSIVKNKFDFVLAESFYSNNKFVHSKDECFENQIIVTFVKNDNGNSN